MLCLSAWLALFLMLTTEVTKVQFLATDPPPPPPVFTMFWSGGSLGESCRVPSLYSQLITAEFSTNYLMVRYPNIKIYAMEVKYRFLLLTSVTVYAVVLRDANIGFMIFVNILGADANPLYTIYFSIESEDLSCEIS